MPRTWCAGRASAASAAQHAWLTGLVLWGALTAAGAADPTTIKNLVREVNLRGPLAKIQEKFEFASEVGGFKVCLPAELYEAAYYINFSDPDNSKQRYKFSPTTLAVQPAGHVCVDVAVHPPRKEVKSAFVLAHVQHPKPREIPQMASQLVTFSATIQAVTPHPVTTQTTTVFLPSSRLVSHSRPASGKASASDTKIVYSGLGETAPFRAEPLELHYENHKPFIRLLVAERDFTVTHHGVVHVEERYTVQHSGAIFTGSFNRWNYSTSSRTGGPADTPYIESFSMQLPRDAADVTYRDELGHILRMRESRDQKATRLRLEPRFPIFGGWKTNFVLNYNVPLEAVAAASGEAHVFRASFSPPFDEDFAADSVVLRLALPEGARDLYVNPDWLPVHEEIVRTFTWFDTFLGRPTVVLSMASVTRSHRLANLRIGYRLSPLFAWLLPAVIVSALLAAALFCSVLSRLDWRLTPSSPADAGPQAGTSETGPTTESRSSS